jgi:hypothetical protein
MSALRMKPAEAGDRVIVKFRGEVRFEGVVLKYDAPYRTAVKTDEGKQLVVETHDQKWTIDVLEEAA